MATNALEAVLPGLQLPPEVVAAGGTPEAVRPSDGDEPPGAGVVVGEQALEGNEAGGDFGPGTVPRQECHANIPSPDIPDTMPCVAGTMCISNCAHMSGVDAHALCGAHHLHELRAIAEIGKEPWATELSALLNSANQLKATAQGRDETKLSASVCEDILAKCMAILAEGPAFHERQPPLVQKSGARGRKARRPGHNLIIRLRDCRDDVLRFLADFTVPFTNNQAEQDLRMKISGAFRTLEGAQVFADLRSVISTARKRGFNILEILTLPPTQIIARL